MKGLSFSARAVQTTISESRVVASTNAEYIKVLENEGYVRGVLTPIDGSELRLFEYVRITGGQAHTALKFIKNLSILINGDKNCLKP